MRRNVFTSYIICNRLNLETFFEPIIDFIEIGKPRGLPLWEPYMRISSRTAQAETPKYELQRICNIRNSLPLWFNLLGRYERIKIRKLFFVVIMPKYQVGSFIFMLIVTGLLNYLFPYFVFFDLLFVFVCNASFVFFSLLLIGILLLRPYESIETSDSY